MKALIADDNEVARAGLRVWLKNWNIIEAIDAESTLKLYKKHKPDVVVLESCMNREGLDCLARLRLKHADANVLVFSRDDNPTFVARAIALGARGYLSKSATSQSFLTAIKAVAEGKDIWTRETLRRATGMLIANGTGLTNRESEVLKLVTLGLSDPQIARALGISTDTAKVHVKHIRRKLNMNHRTQVAVWAVKQGLV